jgi:hypothetical protein
MGATEYIDEFGRPKVYASSKPLGMDTYFTGAGDDISDPQNPVVGGGDCLNFDLTDQDASKMVDLEFCEDVYMKDGFMITENAPFGAYFDIEIVHPVYGVVGSYAKKCPLFTTGWFPLDTDDRGLLNEGLKLRVTVYNAATKVAFKVAARMEMFRLTTV